MADLVVPPSGTRSSRSRGQLILIAAFALAAIFLGLAVLVNSAIFTENLATRGENVESTEALDYRYGVTQFTAEVIDFANEHNYSSHATVHENVSDGIQDVSTYTAIQQIEGGTAISLVHVDTTNGTRIFQNDGNSFTNNQSDPDWTLAEDLEHVRAFELTDTSFTGTLSVIVEDGSDEWTADINDTAVTVTRPDGTTTVCSYGSIESVDITGATVNGLPCPALEDTRNGEQMQFATGISGVYDLRFEGGNSVTGDYSLVAEDGTSDGVSDIDSSDYADIGGPGTGPHNTPAVYSITLEVEYETSRLEYETDVIVAPGEPE